ncbi:hypothetical protein ACE1CB_37725 [Aerosakkonema sp. BLCC-F2]
MVKTFEGEWKSKDVGWNLVEEKIGLWTLNSQNQWDGSGYGETVRDGAHFSGRDVLYAANAIIQLA